jgi:hypothetical protein
MDEAEVRALVQTEELLCVILFSLASRYKVPGLAQPLGFCSRYVTPPQRRTTTDLFLTSQLFLTSMHWLWIYDYFITLGDEVQYHCVL